MWGGWKIACSSLLPWAEPTDKPCFTASVLLYIFDSIVDLFFFSVYSKGLHNFTHPRTDVVVIMIAIDETHDKILLGRGVSSIKRNICTFHIYGIFSFKQRKSPIKYYSGLAGFLEPGESLEDAVARETLEEAGVYVWDVKFHSGQCWVGNQDLTANRF